MPVQPRSMRVAKVPGAINLTSATLSGADIIGVSTPGQPSAQTTINELAGFFGIPANVKSYGATGDGETDDTASIRLALASIPAGGTLFFPPGTYLISEEIAGISNLVIEGVGATIISATVQRSFFYFTNGSQIIVRNMGFDMNEPDLPVYSDVTQQPKNVALFFDAGCSDFSVVGSVFENLYTNAVRIYQSGGSASILGNRFSSPVQTQMLVLEHIQVVTFHGSVRIEGNTFTNAAVTSPASVPGGVMVSGTVGSVKIDSNTFDYCGRDNTGNHRIGVIDFYGNSQNVTVSNNTSTNGMAQFMRLAASWPTVIFGNIISRNANAEQGTTITVESTITYVGVGQVGAQDVDIHDNTFTAAADNNYGVAIAAYDYSVPATRIRIHHNSFNNFKFSVTTGGPYNGLTIESNEMSGTDYASLIATAISPAGVPVTALNGVTESQSSYAGLSIRNNTISTPSLLFNAIFVSFFKSPTYSGTIGTIQIHGNLVDCPAGSSVPAIAAVTGCSPGKGEIYCRHNAVSNFDTGFYMRDFNILTVAQSDYFNVNTPVTESGNTTYNTA